jgi:hypothetical protein
MKKYIAALLAAFCLTTGAATAAQAPAKVPPPIIITFNPGGSILGFIQAYEGVAANPQQRIVVKGECISACTLMLGIVPQAQVCVTPNAMFAFHSGTAGGVFSPLATEVEWYMYPVWIRDLLAKRGMGPDIEHPELIWIPGTTFYHLCNNGEV